MFVDHEASLKRKATTSSPRLADMEVHELMSLVLKMHKVFQAHLSSLGSQLWINLGEELTRGTCAAPRK